MEPEHAWQRLKTRVRKPKELAVLIEVAAWREREAQARDVPRGRVLKDELIGDIAVQAPTTIGAAVGACARCRRASSARNGAQDILEAVKRGLARDPKTLPRDRARQARGERRARPSSCSKVLLRMTAERHGVAAKVIATVDDLERIAADDEADVPALQGWRRELFGEKALALKHGTPCARDRERARGDVERCEWRAASLERAQPVMNRDPQFAARALSITGSRPISGRAVQPIEHRSPASAAKVAAAGARPAGRFSTCIGVRGSTPGIDGRHHIGDPHGGAEHPRAIEHARGGKLAQRGDKLVVR